MRTAKTLLSRSLTLACGVALAFGVPSDAHAANWHIQVQKSGPTTVRLTFDATLGQSYLVCWKLDSLGGDVCGYGGFETDIHVYASPQGDNGYLNGRQSITLTGLSTCGVDYKVRIRRTFVAFDTHVFRMPC